MGISAGGLVSGMDTDSIITAILEVEKAPLKQIERDQEFYQAKISSFGMLKAALSDLQSATSALSDPSSFVDYQATSSNEDTLTVTINNQAAPSDYQVGVKRLATPEKMVTRDFDSNFEKISTGNVTVQVGDGFKHTIEINQTNNTLDGLARAINSSDAELSASIIKVTEDEYKLALTSQVTGVEVDLQFQDEELTMTQTRMPGLRSGEELTSRAFSSLDETVGYGNMVINGSSILVNELDNVESIASKINLAGISGITADVQERGDSYFLKINNSNANEEGGISYSYQHLRDLSDLNFTEDSKGDFISSGFDTDETLGAGIVNVSGSASMSFQISGTDTLYDISGKINDLDNDISARVARNGDNKLELKLKNINGGELKFQYLNDAGKDGLASLDIEETDHQTAKMNVNDIPDIERKTNEVSDLVDGVTFTLNKVTPEEERVTVGVEKTYDGIVEKVENFVLAYNASVDTFGALQDYDEKARQAGPLQGDNSVQMMERAIKRTFQTHVKGLHKDINNLINLGIEIDTVGKVNFNKGQFLERLAGHEEDVISFFSETDPKNQGFATRLSNQLYAYLRTSGSNNARDYGIIQSRTEGFNDTIENMEGRKEAIERRIGQKEQMLHRQYERLEESIATLQSTGTYVQQQLGNLPGVAKK